MAFVRDDAVVAALRAQSANGSVLDLVERASAHGDLGDVVFRFAKSTGMRVIPLSTTTFPALVATAAHEDRVVVAAAGMQFLLIRTDEPPAGARLRYEPATELGVGWWRVHPFDGRRSAADIADELQEWFSAANRSG